MSQIRLTKTPEIEKVLAFLQKKYRLLSEAEIIKVVLSEKYNQEVREEVPNAYLKSVMKKAEENYKKGNTSPGFTNAKDDLEWLEKQGI